MDVGFWIRGKVSEAWVGWIFGSTMDDLDAACDIFSGGPIFELTSSLFKSSDLGSVLSHVGMVDRDGLSNSRQHATSSSRKQCSRPVASIIIK
jgi:hypothetical protein